LIGRSYCDKVILVRLPTTFSGFAGQGLGTEADGPIENKE